MLIIIKSQLTSENLESNWRKRSTLAILIEQEGSSENNKRTKDKYTVYSHYPSLNPHSYEVEDKQNSL